jgi:hypothetical protein
MHWPDVRVWASPAAAPARQDKRLVVEDWWGEAPNRPVGGCGELSL